MNDNTVIKVEGLYKKFARSLKRSMAYGAVDLSRNFLGFPTNQGRLRKGEFWALEDINFELKKGDSLGIIGINGAGKSTLLRLLTGIFPPDKGSITVRGKIGSLIAVGAGFHPHLTGRENIYLNGTVLGMSRGEIDEKFESIVNFADIGEFIDAPVSTYSSGMRVRLGFSIAIHRNPDILLIDEILSVGDLSFRNKSLRHMAEYREKANALIFVSHDIEQVRSLCNRIIIIDQGRIIFDGETEAAIIEYYKLINQLKFETTNKESRIIARSVLSSGDIDLKDISIVNKNNEKINEIKTNEELRFLVKFKTNKLVNNIRFSIAIRDDRDFNIIWHFSTENGLSAKSLEEGNYELTIQIPEHHLESNVYKYVLAMQDNDTFEYYEKVASTKDNAFIVVEEKQIPRGTIKTDSKWTINKV